MEISIFLARVFGLYFVIMALALLVRPQGMNLLIETLKTTRVIYVSGLFALMLGIPLVIIHNVWDGTWRVVVTLIVWLVLLKGIFRVLFPGKIVAWVQGLAANTGLVKALVWLMLAIGLYLVFVGFDLSIAS